MNFTQKNIEEAFALGVKKTEEGLKESLENAIFFGKGWEDIMFKFGEIIVCNTLALSDKELKKMGYKN